MATSADGEHWLFGTAARPLRLDIASDSLCGGPVALTIHVARLDKAAVVALARLIALARDGRWHRRHFPAARRPRRWTLGFRATAAPLSAATHPDSADGLFGTRGRSDEPRVGQARDRP